MCSIFCWKKDCLSFQKRWIHMNTDIFCVIFRESCRLMYRKSLRNAISELQSFKQQFLPWIHNEKFSMIILLFFLKKGASIFWKMVYSYDHGKRNFKQYKEYCTIAFHTALKYALNVPVALSRRTLWQFFNGGSWEKDRVLWSWKDIFQAVKRIWYDSVSNCFASCSKCTMGIKQR